jgi:hypothetical protein
MDGVIELGCHAGRAGEDMAGSPARARLGVAIAELAAAEAALGAAQEPATRLAAIVTAAAGSEAELAKLRAEEERRVGLWLAAGGRDVRPVPDPAIGAAEAHHAALAADAAAARAALPAAEAAYRHCAETVVNAQRRRDEALCAVAAEAADGFAREYRAALLTALRHEAVLHGLRAELLRRGNGSNTASGALEAAGRVAAVIAETKKSASVRHDLTTGGRLLAALMSDPDARLQMDRQA